MTTDAHQKEYAIQFELGGKTCSVGAVGQGSGVDTPPAWSPCWPSTTTDSVVSPILLEKALPTVVPGTYYLISVAS